MITEFAAAEAFAAVPPPLDVIVAHDYLTQRGGAERVALELARQFRPRELVTSVYNHDQTFDGFGEFDVRESDSRVLQALRGDVRRALPVLAGVWSRMSPVDADVLVCSSSGWSHGLRATDDTLKVVYCHNPARWLYQRDDYIVGHSRSTRLALSALTPRLRAWDVRAAHTADVYVANSRCVADRIRAAYGIEAEVVNPPMSVDTAGPQEPVPGLEPGYFLTIGRPRGYKGTDLLINAFAQMPEHRLVVVGQSPVGEVPANVTALGRVPEAQLRWLYSNATALTSVSHEDFGLTPVEANAFGCPVLVLRAGGFLDSTAEGVSGSFIDDVTIPAVIRAVRGFEADWDRDAIRANAERFSGAAFARKLRDVIDSHLPARARPPIA